jgi:hypothetical protein
MAELLGKGVGSWTSSKDAEFSNFIWGSNSMFDNVREDAIERARLKILADKKAKKDAENNTKEDDVVSDKNLGLEGMDNLIILEEQRKKFEQLEVRKQNQNQKPPYLLYGGIGLVVIVGAMFIFTRK